MIILLFSYLLSLSSTFCLVYFVEYKMFSHVYYWSIPLYFIGSLIIFDIFLFSFILFINSFLRKKNITKMSRFLYFLVSEYAFFISYKLRMIPKKNNEVKRLKGIFIFNHRSVFDAIIVNALFYPNILFYIMKKEIFDWPVCGKVIAKAGSLLLDREDPRSAISVFKIARERLKNYSLGIFPEGTRNKTENKILSLHPGAFKIAYQTNLPIHVIKLENVANAKFNHFKLFRKRPEIKLLKSFFPEDFLDKTTDQLAKEVEKLYKDN